MCPRWGGCASKQPSFTLLMFICHRAAVLSPGFGFGELQISLWRDTGTVYTWECLAVSILLLISFPGAGGGGFSNSTNWWADSLCQGVNQRVNAATQKWVWERRANQEGVGVCPGGS